MVIEPVKLSFSTTPLPSSPQQVLYCRHRLLTIPAGVPRRLHIAG